MRKKYIILVEGWVREDQVDLLEKAVSKVSNEITEALQYQCMPRLYIKEKDKK
jgi:hypothetical protein